MTVFDGLMDQFLEYMIVELDHSMNTIEAYSRDVMQYLEFLSSELGIEDVKEIIRDDIQTYIAFLHDQQLSSSSISRKISSIRLFHKFLYLNDYVDENLLSYIVKPKEKKSLPTVLSVEQVDKLINSFDESDPLQLRNKTMIELMYSTGLRVSELVNLKLNDLHFTTQTLSCVGKGNKERIVPMGERAVSLLRRYIDEVRPKLNKRLEPQILFLSSKGTQLTRQAVWKLLKEQLKICGLNPNISPHQLRHTFASHLLENQVDIRYIQELLGHSDISTTQIYTHVDTKTLNEVVNLYHPRNRKGSGVNDV